MDSQELFRTDRSAFNSELDELIKSAANPKPGSMPVLKRPAVQDTPTKRVKTVHGSDTSTSQDEYSAHVHPSRLVLLDRSKRPELRKELHCPNGSDDASGSNETAPTPAKSAGSPLSSPTSLAPTHPRAWDTLSNTIRRQWDANMEDIDYEHLLQQRRNERLRKVDRYVPTTSTKAKSHRRNPTQGLLERLPEKVLEKIFAMVLVKSDPIQIDFYWLRPFVNGHARVPNVNQALNHDGEEYTFPVGWDKLLSDVENMKEDMHQFSGALEMRDKKTRHTRSPCRGLPTALLRMSKKIHTSAAKVFYSQNVFKFPCATSSWMHLESFMATIGPENAKVIKRLVIHVPLWYRGIQEDFVEGAIVDALSPASRFGVIKPPAHDRLFSAMRHIVPFLVNTKKLESLTLHLENGTTADFWAGRYVYDKRLISMSDAEEHVQRKKQGQALLNQLSDMLAAQQNRPLLKLCRPTVKAPAEYKEFRRRLPHLVAEAEKYGWQVDRNLSDTR